MQRRATRARSRLGLLVVVAAGLAACSGDDDAGPSTTDDPTVTTDTPPATTRVGTAAPTTTPTTTTAPATVPPTTADPQPPAPVVEQRIEVAGPEEVVFDWTTDQCEPEHIPDIAARAFRNSAGQVSLTIGHWDAYRMVGPSLDELASDCSAPMMSSDYDPDPAQFDDSEWIGSPFTLDGETVYAVVHNEYRGDTHDAARPGQCPSDQRLPCLDTSFTMFVSTDGGDTFDHIAPPPAHLVASLPYRYIDDSIPTGIRQPSNIIEGPDGFFYLFGNVSDHPDAEQWVCAMRTGDLADPASWRYWDGTGFAGIWKNPYLESVDPDVDKCAPLAFGSLSGGLNEGIVFDEVLDAYVMVGMSNLPGGDEWGVYYSTSTDLVEWTPRRLLVELAINPSVDDPDNDTVHAYPTIIDPDSPSSNFSTTDGQMYLYLSRFNFGGNSLDRDLLRIPIEVRDVELTAPDWSFDVDGDPEGWEPEQDIADLVVAEGAMSLRTTGDDAVLISPPVRVPAAFDTVRIRMSATTGSEDAAAELFFLTDDDPNYDGEKLVVFDVIDDGEFHEYVVEFADVAGWNGIVTRLRFDPITQPDRNIVIDRVWFTDS